MKKTAEILSLLNQLGHLLSRQIIRVLPLCLLLISSCIPYQKTLYLQSPQSSAATKEFILQTEVYTLRPGDVISVQVSSAVADKLSAYNLEGTTSAAGGTMLDPLLRGYVINDSGRVVLPVFGNIEVLGLSVEQAQQKIYQTALEYFPNPSVRVSLLSFYVTLLGEFNQPGRRVVYNQQLHILEALALGGELMPAANRSALKLVRIEKGKATTYTIDLTDEKLLTSPLFYLRPNDVLYAEPLKVKNVQFNNTTVVSLIGTVTNVFLFVVNILVLTNR